MPRSNRDAGGDNRLRPYRDGGRDQLWPPDDARRFYAVRSRMMHDIRAACAAQRPTPWDAGGGLPVDAGYQGLAPNEETILRAVLFTFQPPGARQPRALPTRAGRAPAADCLGWPALSEMALAVGGLALSRQAYEDACTIGRLKPGYGFASDDLGRFYRLPHAQGFLGILRPLRLAYDRAVRRSGTSPPHDGGTHEVLEGVRAQAYLAMAPEYARTKVPTATGRGSQAMADGQLGRWAAAAGADGPLGRGGKHNWPSVLDDDVLGYVVHATNNLAAVIADPAGATCVCCLQHPVVGALTDTTHTSTVICELCGCDAVVPTSVIQNSETLAAWHAAGFQTFPDYRSTEERCYGRFARFCDEWCAEHRSTLHDEAAAARYMRAEEVARAADITFAVRLQRLACPSTPAGTCPAMEVYDCDYCHDVYVESHRQSCPSTPRGTCIAIADWDHWNHGDPPYCTFCHDDPPRTARRERADVCAGCDNLETTWRCECTCACGSPSGHPGLCAAARTAAPTTATADVTPAAQDRRGQPLQHGPRDVEAFWADPANEDLWDFGVRFPNPSSAAPARVGDPGAAPARLEPGAGLPTWRVLLELDAWGDVWRDVTRLARP